jgi:hypothetical protein
MQKLVKALFLIRRTLVIIASGKIKCFGDWCFRRRTVEFLVQNGLASKCVVADYSDLSKDFAETGIVVFGNVIKSIGKNWAGETFVTAWDI